MIVSLPTGAVIHFEPGYEKRCPKWMKEIGIEWLYNLISKAKRIVNM